jgi:hypothetical protein
MRHHTETASTLCVVFIPLGFGGFWLALGAWINRKDG